MLKVSQRHFRFRVVSTQTEILLVVMTTLLSTSASGPRIDGQIVIVLPLSCDYPKLINTTLEAAIAAGQARVRDLSLATSVYDSCSELVALSDLVSMLLNRSQTVSAIVGPGMATLCSVFGHLATMRTIPLVSWSCQSRSESGQASFPTLLNGGPSGKDTAALVVSLLFYFRWQFVSILLSSSSPFRDQATEVNIAINSNPTLGVSEYIEVVGGLSMADATAKLMLIKSHNKAKALLLLVPVEDAETILRAASVAGMANGDYAIFLVDVFEPLVLTDNGTLDDTFNVQESDPDLDMAAALQVTMILKAHAQSFLQQNNQTQMGLIAKSYSQYNEYLYNTISLAYQTIADIAMLNESINDGSAFVRSASHLTFPAMLDTITTDAQGDIPMYFSVWDFDPESNNFQLALEARNHSIQIEVSPDVEIKWPAGRVPAQDVCAFTACHVYATPLSLIVAPSVIVPVVAIAAIIVLVIYFRWRWFMKELKQGPMKILISPEDVVFVSPKTLGQSKASLSEKSSSQLDRRKSETNRSTNVIGRNSASQGTLQDLNLATSGSTNLARYNGDIVFMKAMRIKGFEVSGKLRGYLKSLRELRHENVNPFIGCYIDPMSPALVYDYCTRKSLEEVLYNDDIKLDWEFKLSLLTDLVMLMSWFQGMRYLHLTTVRVHGNLKSSNCVIDSRWVLKITDVGVKGIYERCHADKTFKSYSNTELLWTAPEMLRSDEHFQKGSAKADVYSFAIICQEIILRSRPFSMLDRDVDEIIQKIRKPPPLCRPSVSQGAAPPEYIQIMKQCWSEQPDMRPDFEEIHSSFKSINKGRKVNIVDTMFRMLEKYSNDLEEIVRVRTVALEDERKKTENLLTQMLPPTVARALITGNTVDPETYDEVTIYFSDIVGFTTISAMSTPLEVVQLLNDLYTVFDSTIDDYDVYKVETIGDAYMVCSGLPGRNGNRHAGEISTLSLDLLSQCAQFQIRHMPDLPLRIRIGIHTGSCVAGVVGLRMPRYCLFGDTVNTASRMESTGTAFRIHVSSATREILLLLGGYNLQFRGEVELKGKGIHKTYWLVGKDGFTKPLPEAPEQVGEDNHGLGAYGIAGLQANNTNNANNANDKKSPTQDASNATRAMVVPSPLFQSSIGSRTVKKNPDKAQRQ